MPLLHSISLSMAAFVLALAPRHGSATDRSAGDKSTYRSELYGVSMTPPDFTDDGKEAAFTFASFKAPAVGDFTANITLQRQKFKAGIKAYVELSETQFKAGKFDVSYSKPKQIGKHDGHEFKYSATIEGVAMKFHALAVEDGDDVLLISCTALAKNFDDYASKFTAALASVKLDD
jgi:hypothetical protein